MRIERDLVFVRSDFQDKNEVVEFLGQQLVRAGAVEPGYVQAMHKREADVGTYITEGVAIPHGTEESRSLVKRTAIAVLKIPEGVAWLEGKKVYLAFGIAGNNDDHVELLGALATLLMDPAQKQLLLEADTAGALFACINRNIE